MEKKMEKNEKGNQNTEPFLSDYRSAFSNCTVYQHLRCTDLCLHKSALCRNLCMGLYLVWLL